MLLFISALIILAVGVIMVFASKQKKSAKMIAAGITVVGCLLAFVSCIVSVPTGHTGVVATFGKVEDYTFEAGVHVKLPYSDVINMDNRTQKGTIEMSCFSSDIQEVNVNYTVNYRIEKSNAQTIYKTANLYSLEITDLNGAVFNSKGENKLDISRSDFDYCGFGGTGNYL